MPRGSLGHITVELLTRDPARWQNFTVFVHDCNREGEDALTRALLGEPVRETGSKKLREFRYGGGASSGLR